MGQWVPSAVWLPKISSFLFSRKNKPIQVWKNLRTNKLTKYSQNIYLICQFCQGYLHTVAEFSPCEGFYLTQPTLLFLMGHHFTSRQLSARTQQKKSKQSGRKAIFRSTAHTHNKKMCTVFLHCLGRDGVTSSLSVPSLTPSLIFFTSSSIVFSSHFSLPLSCCLVQAIPDLLLISISCFYLDGTYMKTII